jgi:hypothetical protein
VDADDERAAFVDDIVLASEQFILARLGPPVEGSEKRSRA